MNKNFRLVILDHAISHLDNPATQKALNDVIVIKQQNFLRTVKDFVIMDKHDMIGTHYLIYDVTAIYNPKLILAIRTTFEDRASQYHLKTPIQDLVPKLKPEAQLHYENFRSTKRSLADCNTWFVDVDYTEKKSGLKLSDIGYAMVYAHVTRMGFDHILGCTNERYKASRWLEHIGHFDKSHTFIHPTIPFEHMFIIVEKFNKQNLNSIYKEYDYLFDNLLELLPPDFKHQNWDDAKAVFYDNVMPLVRPKAS